jgi:hypothetical protein
MLSRLDPPGGASPARQPVAQRARWCGLQAEALVHAFPFAVPFGQLVPLRSGPQDPQNTVDEQAVVICGSAGISLLAPQHVSDKCPLSVIELVSLRHVSHPESVDPRRNESEPIPEGNPEYRLDLVQAIGFLSKQ